VFGASRTCRTAKATGSRLRRSKAKSADDSEAKTRLRIEVVEDDVSFMALSFVGEEREHLS
jgi:hypothetical protein